MTLTFKTSNTRKKAYGAKYEAPIYIHKEKKKASSQLEEGFELCRVLTLSAIRIQDNFEWMYKPKIKAIDQMLADTIHDIHCL